MSSPASCSPHPSSVAPVPPASTVSKTSVSASPPSTLTRQTPTSPSRIQPIARTLNPRVKGPVYKVCPNSPCRKEIHTKSMARHLKTCRAKSQYSEFINPIQSAAENPGMMTADVESPSDTIPKQGTKRPMDNVESVTSPTMRQKIRFS